MTLDASTVIEEVISKGTAKVDPEEMIGQEIDIGMIEDGDREARIDHLADLTEMTQDPIPGTEAESTKTTGTLADMVIGTAIDGLIEIVTMIEEVEDVIEDRITLVTRRKETP